MHEITQIIRNSNRSRGCILGDVSCAENRKNKASHPRYTQMYSASAYNPLSIEVTQ